MPSARFLLTAALLLLGAPIVWRTLRGLLRGQFAADVVASLAIITAVLLGEPIPGLVVVLMQTGGEALERYAEGRASRAVRALEDAAPRVAHRIADEITDVPVGEIEPGELVLVRPGEIIPCDGVVEDGRSHLDTSSLTGEPVPRLAEVGTVVASGAINQEGALTIRVTAPAEESQYARIVELVRSAQASKAPIQRIADKVAIWFTPATLAVAGLAWLGSGEVARVLAVLVVATPCPLILATPVAIIGGINRGARHGIVMRSGGALEALARVDTVVFDKTGTLTIGRPDVSGVTVAVGVDRRELLRLAGAVESHSGHLLARSLTEAALRDVPTLPPASAIVESPGRGVAGSVEGRQVVVGSPAYVLEQFPRVADELGTLDGSGLRAWVAADGRGLGVVSYADHLRPGLQETFAGLRALGLGRMVLLSGDSQANADAVAQMIGVQDVRGDLRPEEKVIAVRELEAAGRRVLMVGDGTNDAPALSTATVGIALAAHGGGISAEAADVVLLRDDIGLARRAVSIGRRTMRIARQSIYVGLGLSMVAMAFAALGLIQPVAGALLQETIDVAVILNALRSSVEVS
ncbi:MAG TPA: heavy metal translocating P-type ATPase [Gemmatimonadales bacterium]|nr:heavy metal translocating P-type ATPase [Gemmatimonadales bacterium]